MNTAGCKEKEKQGVVGETMIGNMECYLIFPIIISLAQSVADSALFSHVYGSSTLRATFAF